MLLLRELGNDYPTDPSRPASQCPGASSLIKSPCLTELAHDAMKHAAHRGLSLSPHELSVVESGPTTATCGHLLARP